MCKSTRTDQTMVSYMPAALSLRQAKHIMRPITLNHRERSWTANVKRCVTSHFTYMKSVLERCRIQASHGNHARTKKAGQTYSQSSSGIDVPSAGPFEKHDKLF